ncbi:subtilisin-like protein [Cryphonectria parasitica EP155]|uniref:tripeptidyl-peptidase II n=1 Tax=Cryphonectria parasitica (strain ATCC 38755 / EP155) TaxID=660469 RepID=A0A9P4Y7U7_CRYP1|nr:subtilisin-like protein [Cryphonectria parasitica EP155]KAF3768143.1 subtilisin-like protein [Cryphonectria parasitica EP155]
MMQQGLRDVPASHALHERQLPQWGRKWKRGAKVSRDALLPVRVGLKQRNLDHGALMLREQSNPASPRFGKHLSADEVIDLFAPSETSVAAVMDWLTASGISADRLSLSANKQWIQFDAQTHEVEDILFADFYVFTDVTTGTKTVAVDEYHLPKDVQEHVDYVTPGIKMRPDPRELKKAKHKRQLEQTPVKRSHKSTVFKVDEKPTKLIPNFTIGDLTPENCDTLVTTDCIRAQYSIPNNTLAAPGNELGIFESLDDHYGKYDLDVFFSTLHPYIPNGTYPKEELIDGAVGSAEAAGLPEEETGVESDLDFQASWPLIWPQGTVLYQTDDQYYEVNQTTLTTPYFGFYNTFFDALDGSYCTYSAYGETGDCTEADCLDPVYPDPNPGGYKGQLQCGVYEPTNVISISYGGGEGDLPASYLERQCNEIMKLGLQGTTVVMSSGDYGVGSYPGDFGYASGCAGPDSTVFYPDADATCPYVLAVGSTQFEFPNNDTSAKPIEVSTTSFPSGGGFSNYFEAPSWQTSAISTYFDEVSLNFTGYAEAGTNFSDVGDGVYHIGGRGYPDVSAIGSDYVTFTQGNWYTVSGTSLSSPVWGSILTLVNEHRLAANKTTIGFVNEILYSHPEVFYDVTTGSNPNCDSTGFLASTGWDPVSGLGTPNFPKLLELLLSV